MDVTTAGHSTVSLMNLHTDTISRRLDFGNHQQRSIINLGHPHSTHGRGHYQHATLFTASLRLSRTCYHLLGLGPLPTVLGISNPQSSFDNPEVGIGGWMYQEVYFEEQGLIIKPPQ